ncbi:hypothetical protein Trydic_g2317 [Trypoxylus dichotomus]
MSVKIYMSTGKLFYVRRCRETSDRLKKRNRDTGDDKLSASSLLKILEEIQLKNAITSAPTIMSKSMNMLRTRRRDNNVKPNRKLDRKSSRGMIYENEELRLKTININAEVERGQSDIKKLKRENELLKKEIWSLRDEYDKLDKLLKEKEISFSSSSTTCTSETRGLETHYSCMKGVWHKTWPYDLTRSKGDEEVVITNGVSELTIQVSLGSVEPEDIIELLHSYSQPLYTEELEELVQQLTEQQHDREDEYESCSTCSDDSDQVETSQNLENVQKTNLKNLHVEFDHLSVVPEENSTENSDRNSNRASLPNENWNNEKNIIKPDQSYPSFEALSKSTTLPQMGLEQRVPKHFFAPIKTSKSCGDSMNNQFLLPTLNQNIFESQSQHLLPNMDDFRSNFLGSNVCTTRIHPVFEGDTRNMTAMTPVSKSSTDLIVKMDNKSFSTLTNSSFSNGGNLEQLLNDIESISQDILKLSNPNLSYNGEGEQFDQEIQSPPKPFDAIPENCEVPPPNKPYKSELNVVLMPTAMPLIGCDKYRNIQSSLESIRSKSMENLPSQNFPIEIRTTPDIFYPPQTIASPLGYMANTPNVLVSSHDTASSENPFFFGNASPNDYFDNRYNPDNYINTTLSTGIEKNKKSDVCNSKTNLLELNSEQVSSENEENLKFKTSKNEKEDDKGVRNEKKAETKKPESKTPKLSIRRKVSIHFKGKKDKKNKSLDQLDLKPSATPEKKHSLFDIKFTTTENRQKESLQKTPSVDSKKNSMENGLEVKTSITPDPKRNSNETKIPGIEGKLAENIAGPDTAKTQEKKAGAKSASVSPERKHVHVKEESKKSHKKHKKGDKKNRRSTVSAEKFYNDRFLRERSFSVCTERSNMLGMGLNSAFSMYDDCPISDRERTNSLSSCGTIKLRKMSNISNFPISGKIPWCACWGNGCL